MRLCFPLVQWDSDLFLESTRKAILLDIWIDGCVENICPIAILLFSKRKRPLLRTPWTGLSIIELISGMLAMSTLPLTCYIWKLCHQNLLISQFHRNISGLISKLMLVEFRCCRVLYHWIFNHSMFLLGFIWCISSLLYRSRIFLVSTDRDSL